MGTPLNKWISVKDAMPRKGLPQILVPRGSMFDFVDVIIVNNIKKFRSKSDHSILHPQFWMLLSKPKTK